MMDLSPPVLSAADYRTKPMSGLRVKYSSATAVIVETGSAVSSDGKVLMTLAAESTVAITTAAAALGLDETTLTATCTTSASTSGTMSASIWTETAMTNTVKSLTGTVSTVGTAATGTSTKFLSELAVGDVIRSATKGASRVTAIASDTACTIVAALPGGDCTNEAATAYENLTFWPDTAQAGDKRRVDTITHNGLTVVWTTASTSNGAGKTAKIGVEVVSCWYFPWVVYGGSGTTSILSTQRTRPYGVTGYTTAWRRIPCALYNNSSGDIAYFDEPIGGALRLILWNDAGVSHRMLSAGASATYVDIPLASGGVPPTAKAAVLVLTIYQATSSANNDTITLDVQSKAGSATYGGIQCGIQPKTAGDQASNYSTGGVVAVTAAGIIKYKIFGAGTIGGNPAYVDVSGWWEAS